MTFDEIIENVEAVLQDLPDETQARIPYFIQEAQRRIEDSHGFLSMESFLLAAADPANGRQLVTKPIDWRSKMDDAVLVDGFGKTTPLAWLQREQSITDGFDEYDPNETGRPKALVETDASILVYPLPDLSSPPGPLYTGPPGPIYVDGIWRIRIPYWARAATLSPELQQNWWTENAHRYLIDHAASQGFLLNRDYPEHARWEGETLLEKRRLVNFDKRARLPRHLALKPAQRIFRAPRRF